MSTRLIQDLHSGISRRDWSAVETAANSIRDESEKVRRALAATDFGSLPHDYPTLRMVEDRMEQLSRFYAPPEPNVTGAVQRLLFSLDREDIARIIGGLSAPADPVLAADQVISYILLNAREGEYMDEATEIRGIIATGYWTASVFDCAPSRNRRDHPNKNARTIRVQGEYRTEQEALNKAEAIIADGRPSIETFIHQPSAKPMASFNLSRDAVNALGRMISDPSPEPNVGPTRWRVFEDITHGWWGIEEDIRDGNTILYPKKMNREPLDGIVRAHNEAITTGPEGE